MDAPGDPTNVDPVAVALGTYLDAVDAAAPGLVEGLYVVGSYALDDWVPEHSDIDVVVLTSEPATDDDFAALRAAHADLTERQPRPCIDGPYLAWPDVIAAPATALHRPWTLDGELHHDGECFEINPVTWYTLATYGVTVRGPTPDTLQVWLDLNDRIRFVIDNLHGYWATLADDIERACRQQPDRVVDASLFEWCALGALRLHYTAFTGDVTSKRGAGEHGLTVAPKRFHDVLARALAARRGKPVEVGVDEMAATAALTRWVIAEVDEANS